MYRRRARQKQWRIDRISLLQGFLMVLFLLITARLFQLQVLDYQKYSNYAQQRMEDKIIPARRGRILLKDGKKDFFELANNVSLELLFADPHLIKQRIDEKAALQQQDPDRAARMYAPSPVVVSKQLGPILFEMVKEQATYCDQNEDCLVEALENSFFAQKRFLQQREYEKRKLLEPDFDIPEPPKKSEEELLEEFISDLYQKLTRVQRDYVVLKINVSQETIKEVQNLALTGVGNTSESVWANPLQVIDPEGVATALSPLLDLPVEDLETVLRPRPNRYEKIKNRIDFETAQKIRALNIVGLGFYDEHWRNYAEQEGNPFAPQVIGFLDHSFDPVYGIEKSMNELLAGKRGYIRGEVDLHGRTLTARSSSIQQAINGTDIVLTIDQVIQNEVERLLKRQVINTKARRGEVIVQDPSTGAILAMATYPGFNLNKPGDVYEKEPIELTDQDLENLETVATKDGNRYFLYYNPGYKIELFKKGEDEFLRYKNKEGIRVYRNPTVSDIYEPGSVFKAMVMAAALDSKEVSPILTFNDDAPLKVDCHYVSPGSVVDQSKVVEVLSTKVRICDYTIKNSTNKYYGTVTMTQVLEKSLNTGMAFVAKKLGRNLLYDYLRAFGFGEKTFIELPDENSGKLPHPRQWIAESDLVTKTFGQGIAATSIQMVNAFSSLVNGGLLMQPTLIAGRLDENGNFVEQKPKVVRRAIDSSTSQLVKSMLVSAVKRGVAHPAGIENYKIGGKTGTSQIATRGLYEKGDGSTIASFAGFAPYENPRFTILVKIDRPRTAPWGAIVAAPLFKDISEFLLNYLQIPPDDLNNNLDLSEESLPS